MVADGAICTLTPHDGTGYVNTEKGSGVRDCTEVRGGKGQKPPGKFAGNVKCYQVSDVSVFFLISDFQFVTQPNTRKNHPTY